MHGSGEVFGVVVSGVVVVVVLGCGRSKIV